MPVPQLSHGGVIPELRGSKLLIWLCDRPGLGRGDGLLPSWRWLIGHSVVMMHFNGQVGIRPNLVDPTFRFIDKVFGFFIFLVKEPICNSGEDFYDAFAVFKFGIDVSGGDGGEAF